MISPCFATCLNAIPDFSGGYGAAMGRQAFARLTRHGGVLDVGLFRRHTRRH